MRVSHNVFGWECLHAYYASCHGVDSDCGSDTSDSLCLESGFSGIYLTTLILHSSYRSLHFCSLLLAAKYCPLESGILRTSVMALGREGVWHLNNLDIASYNDEVKAHIDNPFLLQPEESE